MRRNFSESSEIQRFYPPKIRWSPKKKRSSPNLRLIFWPISEIQTFFPPKIRWSPKKKKVFTEFETDFLADIGNSNVFSAQNQVVSKKKVFTKFETDFLADIGNSNVFSVQNQVVSKKKRSSPNLRLIFRPKSEIQPFEGGCFPMGGGAIFNFSQKIGLKTTKMVRFCILHKPMGSLSPPPAPAWLRYCLVLYDVFEMMMTMLLHLDLWGKNVSPKILK